MSESGPIVQATVYRPTLTLSYSGGSIYVSAWNSDGSGSHWQRSARDPSQVREFVEEWIDRFSTGREAPNA